MPDGEALGRRLDEERGRVVEELRVGRDARGDERPARGEVREDLEGRVLRPSRAARRGRPARAKKAGQLGGRALPGEDRSARPRRGPGPPPSCARRPRASRPSAAAGRGARGRGRRAAARRPGRARSCRSRGRPARGRGPARGAGRPTASGRRRRPRVDERRVLDLEDGHLRRAGPHPVGQAGADGDRGGGVPQRVALERLGQPEDGPAGREAGVAELVGDRRVHVHDEGDPEEAGERRDQVRRLLDRVDDVVAAEAQAPRGLGEERARRGPSWRATGRPSRARPGAAGSAGAGRPRRAPAAPCGNVSRSTCVAERGERPRHVQHGERRAAHLEERLGGEEEDPHAGSRWRSTQAARADERGRPPSRAHPARRLPMLGGGGLVDVARRRSAGAAARRGRRSPIGRGGRGRACAESASHRPAANISELDRDRGRHRVPQAEAEPSARPARAACRAGGSTKSSTQWPTASAASTSASSGRRFRQKWTAPKAAPHAATVSRLWEIG